MELNGEINIFFNRGWVRLFKNIIFNITGLELLDGMSSKKRRGVYLILFVDLYNYEVDLEYIGSSQNMQKRLYEGNHEVFDKLIKRQDFINKYVYVYYIDTNKYLEIEKLLIKSLRPNLNKQYNGTS